MSGNEGLIVAVVIDLIGVVGIDVDGRVCREAKQHSSETAANADIVIKD